MMEDIKPCPFCGNNPKLVHVSKNGKEGSQIECTCGVISRWYAVNYDYASDNMVIETWNRRVNE